MQAVSIANHPPQTAIAMLPIIDINPSDYTCLYSTLLYVIDQSKKLGMITPCVTFDQPLWFKAKSLDIVVCLGGFHTLMSFVGAVGSLIVGSGLSELLRDLWRKYSKAYFQWKSYCKGNSCSLIGGKCTDSKLAEKHYWK